jgi:hypothetical protein
MESNPTPENILVPATLPAQFLPVAEKKFVPPAPGEVITSFRTQNTYTIGSSIGEGNFGMVLWFTPAPAAPRRCGR